MPDEKKDHSLDDDILQGKADILKALRAAGKPAPQEQDKTKEPSASDSEEITIDIPDVPEMVQDEDLEAFLLEDSGLSASSADSEQRAPIPIIEIDDSQTEVPAENMEHIKQEHRELQTQISKLTEENTRLKSDLQDQFQTGNQAQKLRSELSETEVALSRERSKSRMLETQLSETENLKITFEQERDSLNEQVQDLDQKKQEVQENFQRLHTEFSDYQEQTGREIVDLNQQIEKLSEQSEVMKKEHEELRRDLEAKLSKSDENIRQLNEQRDTLQQENEAHNKTISGMTEEISGLKTSVEQMSNVQQENDSLRSELDQTRSQVSQEQQHAAELNQEIEKLNSVCEENEQVKSQLRSFVKKTNRLKASSGRKFRLSRVEQNN